MGFVCHAQSSEALFIFRYHYEVHFCLRRLPQGRLFIFKSHAHIILVKYLDRPLLRDDFVIFSLVPNWLLLLVGIFRLRCGRLTLINIESSPSVIQNITMSGRDPLLPELPLVFPILQPLLKCQFFLVFRSLVNVQTMPFSSKDHLGHGYLICESFSSGFLTLQRSSHEADECERLAVLHVPDFLGAHSCEPVFAASVELPNKVILTGSNDDVTIWDEGIQEPFLEGFDRFVGVEYLSLVELKCMRVDNNNVQAPLMVVFVVLAMDAFAINRNFCEVSSFKSCRCCLDYDREFVLQFFPLLVSFLFFLKDASSQFCILGLLLSFWRRQPCFKEARNLGNVCGAEVSIIAIIYSLTK